MKRKVQITVKHIRATKVYKRYHAVTMKLSYNRYEYGDCLVTRILVTLSQISHLWSDVE